MALLRRQGRCAINVPLRRATTGQLRPLAASRMLTSGPVTAVCGHPSKLGYALTGRALARGLHRLQLGDFRGSRPGASVPGSCTPCVITPPHFVR